jgi:hypothetical protein
MHISRNALFMSSPLLLLLFSPSLSLTRTDVYFPSSSSPLLLLLFVRFSTSNDRSHAN